MQIWTYLTAAAIDLKRLATLIAALLRALGVALPDLAARAQGQGAAARH